MLKSMRSLTCVRDDMIVILRCCVPKAKRMLFWTKRERSVESQTNSRGFLTYVQNDKGLPPSQYAVILRGETPKNLTPKRMSCWAIAKHLPPSEHIVWDPSHRLWRIRDDMEIPRIRSEWQTKCYRGRLFVPTYRFKKNPYPFNRHTTDRP